MAVLFPRALTREWQEGHLSDFAKQITVLKAASGSGQAQAHASDGPTVYWRMRQTHALYSCDCQ